MQRPCDIIALTKKSKNIITIKHIASWCKVDFKLFAVSLQRLFVNHVLLMKPHLGGRPYEKV